MENKKANLPVHQVDGLKSHGDILALRLFSAPHIDQQQRAANQGTLASPSQVAAPTKGAPDARGSSRQVKGRWARVICVINQFVEDLALIFKAALANAIG